MTVVESRRKSSNVYGGERRQRLTADISVLPAPASCLKRHERIGTAIALKARPHPQREHHPMQQFRGNLAAYRLALVIPALYDGAGASGVLRLERGPTIRRFRVQA